MAPLFLEGSHPLLDGALADLALLRDQILASTQHTLIYRLLGLDLRLQNLTKYNQIMITSDYDYIIIIRLPVEGTEDVMEQNMCRILSTPYVCSEPPGCGSGLVPVQLSAAGASAHTATPPTPHSHGKTQTTATEPPAESS